MVVVLVGVAACLAGIGNDFAQDDIPILTEDPRLADVASWPRFFVEPYWPAPYAPDQYRPLTSLLLSVQYIAGAGSPFVVRLVSYALYAIACVLALALARRAMPGSPLAAAFAALLFAAHPVHVEATALGVGQAELLLAIFTLAAVNHYVSRRRDSTLATRDWLILGACYAAAALSKEQGFLLPAFLVAAELWLVDDIRTEHRRRLWAGYAGLVALAITLVIIRLAVLGGGAAGIAPQNVAEALQGRGLSTRALTALQLTPEWLRLLTWPAHLRLDYSPREFTASSGLGAHEAMGALLLLVLLAIAWAARRRAPAVTFGIAWFAIAILPVSNVLLPTGVLIAERTLFLPSIGWMLVTGGALTATHVLGRRTAATAAFVAALAVAGVVRSALRHREWRDTDALTRAAIRDSPHSWRANANHADLLFREGQPDQGRAAYARAIAAAPSPWWVRHAYARRLYEVGDYDGALAQLATSLAEFPNQPEVLRDAIATLITAGRYAEARGLAARMIDTGRDALDIVRLGRLADSALVAGAPPGAVRVDISSASPSARPPRSR